MKIGDKVKTEFGVLPISRKEYNQEKKKTEIFALDSKGTEHDVTGSERFVEQSDEKGIYTLIEAVNALRLQVGS